MLTDSLDLGGAETHVVTLANRLSAMGHEVTVISGEGRLVNALSGVKHIPLALSKKPAFLRSFFFLWRLFRKERFDVFHAHTRFSAFLCHPLAGKRLVTTAHWVFDATFPKKELTVWGEKMLAVSPDIADYLVHTYKRQRDDITVTVNGIDTERFIPQKRMAARRRIVCCTRLDADRANAAFLLLEVMESLSAWDASLTVVGDGNRFDEFKRKHEKLKEKRPDLDVRLVGGVTDVAPYLADADIFVGVSRAALEGMAAGCAVILAGNEGYLSVFSPGCAEEAEKSNFCCRGAKELSEEALLDDLLRLLKLPRHDLLQMGAENRLYVQRRYGVDRMTRDATSVYEKICKRECVLCGYYGFRNVGDELLSRALTEELKKRGYGRVRFLSSKRLSPRALLSLLKGYDLFLGGGNLLQDGTSRRSLRFYLFVASLAKRIEIYGGIGSLSHEGEKKAETLLRRASCVYARTQGDLRYFNHLGAKRVLLCADTALALHFPKKEKGEDILLAFHKPQACDELSVIAFAFHICRTFGKEHVFLFSMHPEDKAFSDRLSSLCGIEHRTGGADDFLSSLAGCRAVFASRLHAGICALGMGIPFFLWQGEEKCRFFVEDVLSASSEGDFCRLFDFSDRPTQIPAENGIKNALRKMRERISRTI